MSSGILNIESSPSRAAAGASSVFRAWAISLLLAAIFYACVAPTLTWVQFHDPIENLNVATALEMKRGGPWLVPNLQRLPRLAKPPMAAWLTALSISADTMATLNTTDPLTRGAVYDRLMYESRRPALIAASLMLVAVYWLGQLALGEPGGLFTACICATQLLFLRHCRLATTDIYLALWVTTANAFLLLAILHRRRWSGCLGAGVSLGLMLMAKGPIGLIQTLLPMLMFVWILRRLKPASGSEANAPRWRGPIAVGTLLMLLVGGWWFAWVAVHNSAMTSFWAGEISGAADGTPSHHWYDHIVALHLTLPWLPWMVVGLVMAAPAVGAAIRRQPQQITPGVRAAVAGLLLLVVPVLIMSFSKNRFQRYLLPTCPAAALLAAGTIVETLAGRLRVRWMIGVHWIVVAALGLAIPVLMALGKQKNFRTDEGHPLLNVPDAAMIAGVVGLLVLSGILLRKRDAAVVVFAALVMLVFQAVYYRGLGKTDGGQCDLATVADGLIATHPTASLWVLQGDRRNTIAVYGNELSIYMNRLVNFSRSVAEIPTSTTEPQVLVMVLSKRAPALATPAGWTVLVANRDGNAKYVFLRLPIAHS